MQNGKSANLNLKIIVMYYNIQSIYFGMFKNYSRTPLLEDPYEKENVYVAPSKIGEAAGEGLYARKHIRKGQLVCLFNGIRCNKPGHHTTIRAGDDDWSDYRLTLGMCCQVNVYRYHKSYIYI